MTFATDLALIPHNPRQPEATGFLPPIARAAGHLMFVLEHIAATTTPPLPTAEEPQRIALTDDELLGELAHAREHWNAIASVEALSPPATLLLTQFGTALDSAHTEFPDWTTDTRISNLRDLGNRVPAILARLDRELVGLRDSDPGFNF